MKHSDYPLFMAFNTGALQANSGGRVTDKTPMHGTEKEYARAEASLKLLGVEINFIYVLGMLADEGLSICHTHGDNENAELFEDEMLFAYKLLERYY